MTALRVVEDRDHEGDPNRVVRAGLPLEDRAGASADLAISEQGGAKISEVMAGIFGVNDLPHLALRWRFLTSAGDATPLELCARPVTRPVRESLELAPMP